jgi:hypothetical protein
MAYLFALSDAALRMVLRHVGACSTNAQGEVDPYASVPSRFHSVGSLLDRHANISPVVGRLSELT